MTIKEFLKFAKECKTRPELASLAKSNGLSFSKDELDRLFKKISDGTELSSDALEAAAGGSTYTFNEQLKNDLFK